MTEQPGSLIGPDDPAPFQWHNLSGGASVLVVCDHAGRAIPKSLRQLGLKDSDLEKHIAWDIGTDLLGPKLAEALDAPAILASYSRLVVDLNRGLDDPTVFIQNSDGVAIPGNLKMEAQDRASRITLLYESYHRAVEDKLNEFTNSGTTPAIVSVHSFTPRMQDFERPWEIGILWDRDPRIAQPLIKKLESLGLCVGDNQPYSGKAPHDYTIDHHAERCGFPNVSLEIRQDLVSEPRQVSKWVGVLKDTLGEILKDPKLFQRLPDSH